jgi:hypothetical protein
MRLNPGDIITRLTDTPDANQNVTVNVLSSKPADCSRNSQLAIAVQDLQEMYNHFREQIDSGLKILADSQGKGGLAVAPDIETGFAEVPLAAPDANVEAELQKQLEQADLTETQVLQQVFPQQRP